MGGKPVKWWLMVVLGVLAAGVLFKELFDHGHAMLGHAGPYALLTSPTVHHKIGELLIASILFLTALMRNVWPAERLVANLKASRPLMFVGAVLNALAWFGSAAPASDFNKIWYLVLVVVGVAAPPLLIRWLSTPKGTQAEA